MFQGVSREICEKILQGWLTGVPRDQIAQSVGVAEGTITNVMEFYKQNDNTIDLQRQIAIIARKSEIDIVQIASNLRWENSLKRAGSDNESVIQFISRLHKEFDLNGMSENHAITTIVQIADMVTKEKIPLTQLESHLEKQYAELERVELDIAKNKEVQQRSNADVDAVVAKNKGTLDEIKSYSIIKEKLQLYGLLTEDLTKTINVIKNLEQTSFDAMFLIVRIANLGSLERRFAELGEECDYYETNLEKYRVKLRAAEDYLGTHEASAELFANARHMGVSAQDIFDAVTIFGNNPYSRPQEVINDLKTYGDMKAAIFKTRRELEKLRASRLH